jgi:hypothetical protein
MEKLSEKSNKKSNDYLIKFSTWTSVASTDQRRVVRIRVATLLFHCFFYFFKMRKKHLLFSRRATLHPTLPSSRRLQFQRVPAGTYTDLYHTFWECLGSYIDLSFRRFFHLDNAISPRTGRACLNQTVRWIRLKSRVSEVVFIYLFFQVMLFLWFSTFTNQYSSPALWAARGRTEGGWAFIRQVCTAIFSVFKNRFIGMSELRLEWLWM